MDCSPPGSSVYDMFQAGTLEWVAISYSIGSSWPRDWTQVSYIAGRFFTDGATRESHLLQSSLVPMVLHLSHFTQQYDLRGPMSTKMALTLYLKGMFNSLLDFALLYILLYYYLNY